MVQQSAVGWKFGVGGKGFEVVILNGVHCINRYCLDSS